MCSLLETCKHVWNTTITLNRDIKIVTTIERTRPRERNSLTSEKNSFIRGLPKIDLVQVHSFNLANMVHSQIIVDRDYESDEGEMMIINTNRSISNVIFKTKNVKSSYIFFD